MQNSGRSRPELPTRVSRPFDTLNECRSSSKNTQTPARALRGGAYITSALATLLVECGEYSDLSILAGGNIQWCLREGTKSWARVSRVLVVEIVLKGS